MTCDFCLCDALCRVFPEERPREWNGTITALRGETVSFQAAYRASGELRVEVLSPLKERVRLRSVEPVPCKYPGDPQWDDGNYERLRPGLFPDILRELEENRLPASAGQWRALWVDILPGEETGKFPVTLRFSDGVGTMGEVTAWAELLRAELPPQRLRHTQWFHTDCLADYYGLTPWSEEHWRVVGNFVERMARRGINMVLTPLFTPPLDTAVGGERTTVQLVRVSREGNGWRFGFDRLKRWVDLCREKGIEWFEFSHLFTQWGAKAAPKVVDEDGARLFGWDIPAVGGEYTKFLRAFLPELTEKLREWGIAERCCFHISDEPGAKQLADYLAARDSVKELLAGFPCMDALSSYEFYRQGVVETPVVATDHIQPFLENQVENLWVYYCVSQHEKVSNRFFAMPLARCRALGVQLYKFRIAGFLHWGFNFYNSAFSLRHLNPYEETDADGRFPGGDAFVVYPGPGGVPEESMRLMVLEQAMGDLRALEGLEALAGRDYVLELLGEPVTFSDYPKEAEYYLALRERVNREMERRCTDIVIKPMETDEEIEGKAYVHWKSWQETYQGLIDPAYLEGTTLEKCTKTAYQWPDNLLVAKDGERVVGFAGYGAYRDDSLPETGEVFSIYVLEEYHGKGVGQALMQAALRKLAEYRKIAVWVLKGNGRAIRFYEKCGFRSDGAEQTIVLGKENTELRMILDRRGENK